MIYLSKPKSMIAVLTLCGFLTGYAYADNHQPEESMDWPCQQALVTEVPAAVVWAGPSIEGLAAAWEQDDEVSLLVNRMTSPDYDTDSADGEIERFSNAQTSAGKDDKLTLLFAGVHQSLNFMRKKELDGIIRYSQGQAARADRLSQELDEMVRLQDDSSPQAQERLAMMRKEMEIKHRMFDEREAFIEHLCTRPILIEEKLGILARTIAYYLD
jgi:flagellum-specific peptidoglycan hydrolase FlgJ